MSLTISVRGRPVSEAQIWAVAGGVGVFTPVVWFPATGLFMLGFMSDSLWLPAVVVLVVSAGLTMWARHAGPAIARLWSAVLWLWLVLAAFVGITEVLSDLFPFVGVTDFAGNPFVIAVSLVGLATLTIASAGLAAAAFTVGQRLFAAPRMASASASR